MVKVKVYKYILVTTPSQCRTKIIILFTGQLVKGLNSKYTNIHNYSLYNQNVDGLQLLFSLLQIFR